MNEDLIPQAHRQQAADVVEPAELDDIILVNPGGRVIAVSGEHGQELLQENGYRVATAAEAKTYTDYVAANAPEVLRRHEADRVAAERAAADAYLAAKASPAEFVAETKPEEVTAPAETTDAPKPRSRK